MYEKGVASAAPFFLFVHTNYAKICYNIRELIDNGDFERHINRVRRMMRKKLST